MEDKFNELDFNYFGGIVKIGSLVTQIFNWNMKVKAKPNLDTLDVNQNINPKKWRIKKRTVQ